MVDIVTGGSCSRVSSKQLEELTSDRTEKQTSRHDATVTCWFKPGTPTTPPPPPPPRLRHLHLHHVCFSGLFFTCLLNFFFFFTFVFFSPGEERKIIFLRSHRKLFVHLKEEKHEKNAFFPQCSSCVCEFGLFFSSCGRVPRERGPYDGRIMYIFRLCTNSTSWELGRLPAELYRSAALIITVRQQTHNNTTNRHTPSGVLNL